MRLPLPSMPISERWRSLQPCRCTRERAAAIEGKDDDDDDDDEEQKRHPRC